MTQKMWIFIECLNGKVLLENSPGEKLFKLIEECPINKNLDLQSKEIRNPRIYFSGI